VEEKLPSGIFVRCHRSFIINISHIQRLKRYEASTPYDPFIPVGRKYYDTVKESLLKYITR
jgi:DNA-binding LytR/AlgR family response regulator